MTQAPPDIDTDGFPLFPRLPGGHDVPITARSLARLVAGLTTGVLAAHTEAVVANVVFLDGEPIDGMALRDGRRVTGPEALDEIADVAVDRLSFRELPRDLASVAASYFLPTAVREVPAARVVPEAFVRSLARPDGRGCVIVRAGTETGLIFLTHGQVALALHVGAGRVGGLETVAELLADPDARLWARLGEVVTAAPNLLSASVGEPAPEDETLGRLLEMARRRLGRSATSVEEVFRSAPRTHAGLRSAADSVRRLRIRLVSSTTLEEIADGAIAVLGGER